jgi:hypothetical protein
MRPAQPPSRLPVPGGRLPAQLPVRREPVTEAEAPGLVPVAESPPTVQGPRPIAPAEAPSAHWGHPPWAELRLKAGPQAADPAGPEQRARAAYRRWSEPDIGTDPLLGRYVDRRV